VTQQHWCTYEANTVARISCEVRCTTRPIDQRVAASNARMWLVDVFAASIRRADVLWSRPQGWRPEITGTRSAPCLPRCLIERTNGSVGACGGRHDKATEAHERRIPEVHGRWPFASRSAVALPFHEGTGR